MKSNWLWDMKISKCEVKKILRNPQDKKFLKFSAVLLARENSPKEVLTKYITPINFCRNWHLIKKVMRKDKWNDRRIEFWQAIYEKIAEKLRNKNIQINGVNKDAKSIDELCLAVGNKIKLIRKQKGLTQKQLAEKMKVSQQLISRMESGRDNVSLITIKRLVSSLGGAISIDIK